MGISSKKYTEDDFRWAPAGENSYGHFARYYDQLGWKRFTDSTFRKLEKILKSLKLPENRIIDFGCGSGELLARLAEMDFTGSGIDISPGMLENAMLKLDSEEFELLEGDICSAKVNKSFPLAVCFFDTLNHIITKARLRKAIKNISNHIEENGYFVFDFLTPEGLSDWEGTEINSEDEYCVIQRGKYHQRKNRAEITIEGFVKKPDGYYERFRQEIIHRGITVVEMTELLKKAGFSRISMRGFFYDWELEEGGRIFGVALK